ncbi:MAG: 30S ribosomal protein S17 [Waddliaceae bacterium]
MKQEERNKRQTKTGMVISNRMQHTVVVKGFRTIRHPKYGKVIKQAKKYYAHHDGNEALQIGDEVEIAETRPLSKMKRWRVVKKMERKEASREGDKG